MVDPAHDFDLDADMPATLAAFGQQALDALGNIPVGYGNVDGDLVFLLKNGTEVNVGPLPVASCDGDHPAPNPVDPAPGLDLNDVGYDIVIVAGQSNAAGAGTPIPTADVDPPHDRIRQYAGRGPHAGKIIRAIDPLAGAPQDPSGGVGPAMSFGREWAKRTPVNRSLLIVPAAVGGVRLVDGPWQVGALYYQQAIANATAALAAAGANARIVAFLWVQGEGDSVSHVSQVGYANALTAVIDGWRAAIPGAADAKFIIGSMVPEWCHAPNGTSLQINAAQVAVANADPNAVYVPGPTGMNQDTGGIHYSAAGQRELGRRMCLALYGGVPDTVADFTVEPYSSSVGVSWSSAVSFPPATAYIVERRPATGGDWADAVVLPSTIGTIGGLTNGTEYEFRVAAINTNGQGPWSAPVRETPSAYAGAVSADAPLIYIRGDDPMPIDRRRRVIPTVGLGVGSGAGIGDGPRAIEGNGASSSRIRLGHPSALTNVGAFTVEMLVRFDATGDKFLAVRDDAGMTRDWRFALAADSILEFYKFTGTMVHVRTSTPLTTGTTYHLAVTYGSGWIRIYINGQQAGAGQATGLLGGTQEIAIGGRSGGNDGTFGVDGRMAGIALYNKALTAARIAAHATAAGL